VFTGDSIRGLRLRPALTEAWPLPDKESARAMINLFSRLERPSGPRNEAWLSAIGESRWTHDEGTVRTDAELHAEPADSAGSLERQ